MFVVLSLAFKAGFSYKNVVQQGIVNMNASDVAVESQFSKLIHKMPGERCGSSHLFGQDGNRGRVSLFVKFSLLEMRSNVFHEPAHLVFHHCCRFQTITEIENHLAYPRRFDFS